MTEHNRAVGQQRGPGDPSVPELSRLLAASSNPHGLLKTDRERLRKSSLGYGEIRKLLLEAIAEKPRHGYELIQVLGEQIGAGYKPSAGAIYPRLRKLLHEGLITSTKVGRTIVYTITDHDRTTIDEHDGAVPAAPGRAPRNETRLDEALRAVAKFADATAEQLTRAAAETELSPAVVRDVASRLTEAREAVTLLLDSR